MNKTFLITYSLADNAGKSIVKDGIMRVKNKESKFSAQCGLEDFLKRKYPSFGTMTISECVEEDELSRIYEDIFGKKESFDAMFGGIFGGKKYNI